MWAHLKALWAETFPDWEVVEGSDEHDGPWIKATAWRDALERSSGDIVVFCDADCWLPSVAPGVRTLQEGAAWVQAQDLVVRLSYGATEAVIGGLDPLEAVRLGLEPGEPPRMSTAGVGTVLRRSDALAVPLDVRFAGWGWEDVAWSEALQTLVGPCVRLDNTFCVHCWHEAQPDKSRHPAGPNWQLRRRYARARGKPDEMRALMSEAEGSGRSQCPTGT